MLDCYKRHPLPAEEWSMFCYPSGCWLHHAQYCDAPLSQYFGVFVVKNKRGNSIYVSCVSFMEPLTTAKKEQLSRLSKTIFGKKTMLLPANFERKDQMALSIESPSEWIQDEPDKHFDAKKNSVLTAFD
jgi:hypothetical protein